MIPEEQAISFDFDKYVVDPEKEDSTPIASQDVSGNENNEFSFDKYVDEPKSGIQKTADVIGRGAVRLGARVGETALGFPGDFRDFSFSVAEWINEHTPNAIKGENKDTATMKFTRKMLEKLPTSQELKKKSSEITGGFTDPQGALEEFGDDIFELSAMLYGNKSKAPAKASKIVKNFTKALGKATISKSAGELSHAYGATQGQQLFVEMGTLGLMSLINGKMADKYVSDKFKKARELLPENLMADTSTMTRELEALEKELSKGISTPTKNEVRQSVSEMKNKVSGGAHPAHEIVDMMHDLNERMTSKKLFDELGKSGQKQLKYRYNQAKNVVGKEISKIGKSNPAFIKEWSEGMEGFAAIENSKKATRTIEKTVKSLPKHIGVGIAVEALLLQNPKVAVGLGAGFASLKSIELAHRFMSSPTLRKHYINVLDSAMKENVAATAKGIARLDRELKKDLAEDVKKTAK